MGCIRVRVFQDGDGDVGIENLVNECRVVELRWVANRKSGNRGLDEIRMDVLGLIAILDNKVLKERVGRKW